MTSVSYIIPSINRPTLHRTIQSIEVWPGDEVIVEFDLPKSNMWGNPQRNKGIVRAKGDYLAFIDDDDFYLPGVREVMARAIKENPGKANLFKIEYPNGNTIWKEKKTEPGNVATAMILVPNTLEFITEWEKGRNMADQIFINKWPKDKIIWREEIICLTGHTDGQAKHHD